MTCALAQQKLSSTTAFVLVGYVLLAICAFIEAEVERHTCTGTRSANERPTGDARPTGGRAGRAMSSNLEIELTLLPVVL